ncbi:MAG: hypothetical protein ACRDRL_21310, partial [Sciscionella sp.]
MDRTASGTAVRILDAGSTVAKIGHSGHTIELARLANRVHPGYILPGSTSTSKPWWDYGVSREAAFLLRASAAIHRVSAGHLEQDLRSDQQPKRAWPRLSHPTGPPRPGLVGFPAPMSCCPHDIGAHYFT